MDGINIKKSKALEVLIMKIQCDVCWNRHFFLCLIFLRRGKIFSSTSLYHLHSNENGMQFSCVGRCLNVYFDVNSGKISIHSLKHRCNLACVSLFYHYDNEFCSNESVDLFPWIMYSSVTLVFLGKHISLWSIGQWIAHSMTDKIYSLVELFACGTPLIQRL